MARDSLIRDFWHSQTKDAGKNWSNRQNPYFYPFDKLFGANVSGMNPDKVGKYPGQPGSRSTSPGGPSQIPNSYWNKHDRKTQIFDGTNWVNRSNVKPRAQRAPEVRGPSLGELRQYNDAQVRSSYRPKLSALQRQIENANAMGMQSQNAIGGWGREAGQEIASAGRRNYREVGGIQRNLGGMLAAIGAASGNMGMPANNAAYFRGAAGAAGLISGLGAADQGWFNRARDVNAQTTNFYRNNARDQYAQQAYELQQKRNDIAQAMADAQLAGRTQAKQTYLDNQSAGDQKSGADRLGEVQAKFYDAIANGTPVADAARTYSAYLTDPAEIARFNAYQRLYRGPAGSVANSRLDAARKAADKAAGVTQ